MSNTGKSYGKKIVFAVITLALLCYLALAANVVAPINERETALAAATDGIVHGAVSSQTTSGTAIANSTDFYNNIINGAQNGTYYLTSDFTLDGSHMFGHKSTFSGTLHGNGHTITVLSGYNAARKTEKNGILFSQVSGTVRDLTVVLGNGGSTAQRIDIGDGNTGYYGVITGALAGGTISNCRVVIQSNVVFHAATQSSGTQNVGIGGIAGEVWNSASKILNCTVENYGAIDCTTYSGSYTSYNGRSGYAGHIAGIFWLSGSDTATLQNIIVRGNGRIHANGVGVVGCGSNGGYNDLDITNYLNDFSGSYEYNGAGAAWASDAIFFYSGSSSRTIYNYYSTSGATSTSWSYSTDAAESGRLTLSSGYNIYFDATSDVNNAVAFVYNGSYDVITKKLYFQPANSSTKYYPAYRDGNTEVFKGLPSATSTYSATLGTFAFDTVEPPVGKLNKWESGYVSESYSPSGEPEDSESGLYDAISNNRNCHLTSDINITGFRTLSYSGTLDGNGHTIYITVCNENSAETVGGLFGTLTGTVKNLRVVLYVDYTRTATSNKLGTGIIAGKLGGTVDNVYVYIPSNVTFGATGSQEGYVGAVAGVADGTSYTIKNTTVDIDGKIHLDGSWVYMAGFVGKSATGSSAATATYTNNILKGDGSYSSNTSNGTEPIYLAATTVLFQAGTGNPQSTINIDGFINAFTSGTANLNDYSMYGVLTKNDNGKTMSKWTYNVSNVYDYGSPMEDVNNKGTTTGNNYIDVSQKRSTVSTAVDSYAIGVTPYFPAGDTTNLVLVAGDGTESVPNLVYGNHTSAADGNYKVVTVPKSAITAPTTVTLTEPITPATPIADLNQWEHGYVADPITENEIPSDYVGVSSASGLKTAIDNNSNIVLTSDILNFRGFTHTGTYSGILDGNGHTIYIVKASAASGNNIGGLFSTLSGTIKNVRIVVMAGVNLPSSSYVGAVAGALSGDAKVNNVSAIINSGVSLISTKSGDNAGGAGGIAGGLLSGAGTVAISNSTVELNGELNATAKWTFIGGFVGQLNGGNINFTDVIFKGTGALNGTASGGEGVHTAAVAVVGGGVKAVTLDGLINAFTGTKTSNKSAYAITFVRNGSNVATPTISHVYTYGGNFSNEGGMTYGTPVDVSAIKAEIKTVVDGETVPVIPYFPVSAGTGNLVLVAGDGATAAGIVVYGTTPSTAAGENGKYSVITIAKDSIAAGTLVKLTRPRVSAPTLSGSDSKTYNGAGQEFTINELKATGEITLGASDYTLAFAGASEGALLDGSGKPLNAGTYTLTVTLQGYYLFESGLNTATLTVHITKLAINATIDTASKIYGKADPELTFSATGFVGADVKDDLAVTLTREAGDTVGSYAITGKSAAVNYTVTFTNNGAELFTITARPINVTISAVSKVYGVTTDPALTFTVDEAELQYSDTKDALGVTLTRDSGDNVGSYAINGTSSSANYAVTFDNDGAELFTINKRPLHYVLSVKNMNGNATDGYSLEYGAFNATANLGVSIVSGEGYYAVVAGESVTVTPKLPDGGVKNVGTYTIDAIDAAYGENTLQTNYDITLDNTVSFEIVAKAVTIDIKDITKVYGEANPVFGSDNWSLASGFFMAPDEAVSALQITLSLSGDGENVGGYTINGAWNNTNYAVTFNEGTLTVEKRPITVTLKQDFSSVYGEPLAEVTVATALTLAGGSLAPTLPAHSDLEAAGFSIAFNKNISDAGVYGGYISASCANTNYAVTWTDGKQSADYTVTARPVKYTITLSEMGDGYSLIYGDFVESKNVKVSGPVTDEAGFYDVADGDIITVTPFYTYTSPSGTQTMGDLSAEVKNVGTYTVTGNVIYDENTNASNYAVTVAVAAPGKFFIEKRPVNIIISPQTKIYGATDPETLGEWGLSGTQPEGGGMAYGEDHHAVITVADVSYGDVKDVGVYPLTATATSANYSVNVISGTMTVSSKPVTVTINSASKVYGEGDPAFEWSHTALAYDELTEVLGFTVTRETGEDVREGGYALSGTATNDNYEVTVAEGSVLTINPREVSFTVTNAQLPYNMYTAETLPEPAMLGAKATPSLTTLPYGDTVKVTFTYNTTDKAAIVSEPKGEYAYIDTAITFLKSDGASADGNYTVTGEVKCMLVVVSGDLIINLDAYSKTYDFAAGGITISLSSVKVTVASGATVTPALSAKILSSDGLTEYFVSADGEVIISYVPSSVKTETSVNLKFVVTAEAEGYEPGNAEMTVTLNKASYDLTGITFEGKTAGYNGAAHEITYTGTLPEGLTAEVTHTGDNVNYTEAGAKFTLTFALTGEEQNGNIYYSYNLPEARTALLTIEKAPVKITVNPQSSVYDGRTPAASAVKDRDYDIEGTVYAQDGVLDDLGVKLTINGGAQAVNAGEYPLTVSISNANYELTAVNSLYTIEKRPVYIVLTSDYASKVYGDADPDWSQVSLAVEPYDTGESGTGLVGGDGINELKIIKVTRAEGEAAGGYAVTVERDEGGNYYADESRLNAFNIASRPLTVILNKDAFVSVYGEALVLPDPDDENQLKLKEGFSLVGAEKDMTLAQAGFSIAFTGNFGGSAGGIVGVEYTAVGVYKGVVRLSCTNNNYSVTYEGGFTADYTVTKRPVWITVTPVTVEYGDSGELKFELSGIQPEKGGLAWGETADDIGITLTREGGDRPDVGKYNIDCIVGENSNYDVSVMNSPEVVYEVTAREIKIIINDAEKTYGDEKTPVFTWEMAEGYTMAYDDDETALGIALMLADGAAGVDAGSYTITGTSSALGNYLVVFENATFTVHKKQAVIDVGGVKVEYVYTGLSFRITEGASHDNTDVESATSQLKYPDKEFLNVSDSGEYKITIGATKNFYEAEATITVTIAKATVVFDWSSVEGQEYVYDGTFRYVTGVTVNVYGAAVEYANNTFTDVPEGGVLNVTVSVAETENIIGASETRKIPVLRATIDVSGLTFVSREYVFDATEKALTVSGTLPWGIEGVKYAGNALTEVGTTEAVAEFVYNANNFNAVENLNATLTITPRPVAIELESAVKVFGDEDPAYDFTLAAEQPCEGTDKVLAMWALDAVVARDPGEEAGKYALSLTGYDPNYSAVIVSEGSLTITPREIVFAVTGVFESVYDGNEKEVNVNEALTVAGGSLAPVHADIAASGAVSVSVAEGVSIIDAGVYENAIVFTLVGGNYAASFEGVSENVMTADYTVTRREITVKLRDQRLLKEESIDSKAYDVTAGTLVKGDDLGITISQGDLLGVDRYELVAEYTNLNYAVAFESGVLVYTVRAVITAVTPEDFLYTGEPFALDVSIDSTAPLVFYVNGEYAANNFVEPGHYVVTISASADDTYREPLNVTVIFNILAPEIKHEEDGAEISVSTETGFYPEDSFEIIREQGRENSTIAEMISGEYTIVDGYVLNVSTAGGTVTLGEYIRNNAGEDLVVRIKVPEEYANSATVECVIIRSGEASMETVDVKDGYIEIAAKDVEAVAFIAERETLIAVIIIAAAFAIAMLLLGCFYVFRNKAY